MSEQISAAEGRLGRVVVIRLAPGADLLGGMHAACERYGIHNGVVISAIGSLACVRFCDVEALPEKKCGYGYGRVLALDDTIELTGAGGVICSDVDGNINLHVHISMSDKTGKAYGGHLVEGTRVLMTADIVLGEIEGVSMLREYDGDMDVYLLHPQQL
ncbi:MAG: DNA-binding protein [Eubacteriales bacterium]|nr:DNA-binding protein [Eubacteriales bacterium]